jgi:hypothetical protein
MDTRPTCAVLLIIGPLDISICLPVLYNVTLPANESVFKKNSFAKIQYIKGKFFGDKLKRRKSLVVIL